MTKNPPTGSAQSITDFNERMRSLFKDKPEFTPKPSERKNKPRWSSKAKEEAEPAEDESKLEAPEDEAEVGREEDDKATNE
jgi:hypothetical protein